MFQALDRLKESQLLHRIRKGDDAAFVEAYDLFAPKLWKHAYYRTGARETADDILSETFMRAWEFVRRSSKEIQNLRAFLYRVTNNLVVDHYRREGRAPVALDETLERTLPFDAGIEAAAETSMQSSLMHQALGSLRTETREILVMRFIDDLTIEEIVISTGKNRNAVYVALHRAIKELKNVCSQKIPSNN